MSAIVKNAADYPNHVMTDYEARALIRSVVHYLACYGPASDANMSVREMLTDLRESLRIDGADVLT